MATVQRTMCSITVAPLMNQFFIFLYYHFLAYFEKLACTLPYYTFLRLLFHNCNTFTHLLLHSRYTFVTPLATLLLYSCYTPCYNSVTHVLHHFLHLCYTFVTPVLHPCYAFVTLLVRPSLHCFNSYYDIFDASLFCGILSVSDLWHFVRDSYKLYSL